MEFTSMVILRSRKVERKEALARDRINLFAHTYKPHACTRTIAQMQASHQSLLKMKKFIHFGPDCSSLTMTLTLTMMADSTSIGSWICFALLTLPCP